tara:strand:+ start:2044 stop:2355 length:312 start_codon:yes stop_codon:yes gene_type:complete
MIKNVIVESTYTDIVSVPEGTGYANLGIYFCNTTNEDDIIDIFVNGTGNSPSDKTKVVASLPIPNKETFYFGSEKFILAEGESIGAICEIGGRISATVTFTDI